MNNFLILNFGVIRSGLAVSLAILAGCSHFHGLSWSDGVDRTKYLSGPGVSLDTADLAEYQANQAQVVQHLISLAGLREAPTGNWRPLVDAGILYVDQRCEKYVESIFWFSRYKKTATTQAGLLGAATAAAMGIADSAAKEIALTAVAFGLTVESINNIGNTVLYQLEPSGVRRVLERSQEAYKTAIKDVDYTNRIVAVSAIQGYLTLCVPSKLETEVNNAVSNVQFTTLSQPEQKTDLLPSIQQVAPQSRRVSVGKLDTAQNILRSFLIDPVTKKPSAERLAALAKKCGENASRNHPSKLVAYLFDPKFTAQREADSKCISEDS